MEIVIQSLLTVLNENTLDELRDDISREFEHIRVRIICVAVNWDISLVLLIVLIWSA
jgi:hypothetical protein